MATQAQVQKWIGITGVSLIAFLALVAGIATLLRDDDAEPAAAPTSTPAAPAAPATPSKPPLRMRADGTYKIENCFMCVTPPGTYETTVPDVVGRAACKYVRRSDMTGSMSSIIDSGAVERGQTARIAVNSGEYLTVTDCTGWRYIG